MASAAPPRTVDNLADRHRQLRVQVRWLLPVGAALLLVLAALGLVHPSRVALAGYRFGQVGVQADTTWWVLAARDNKAELLFRAGDTSRGWRPHALGVPAGEARQLALDWGGKALLLGNSGTVRVYDAQFRLVDSLQKLNSWAKRQPQGKGAFSVARAGPLRARAVLVDRAGRCAVVIGNKGQVYFTNNGGQSWTNWREPGNEPAADSTVQAGAYVGQGSRLASTRFCLAAPAGYYTLDIDESESDKVLDFSSYFTNWAARLKDTIAWCGIGPAGLPWAVDRRGNWARQDTAGRAAADVGTFLASTVAMAPLGGSGNFLGVGPQGLFSQRMASFLLPKVGKRPAVVAKTPPLTASDAEKKIPSKKTVSASKNKETKTAQKPPEQSSSVTKLLMQQKKQAADRNAQMKKDIEEKRKAYEQSFPSPANQSPVQQMTAPDKSPQPSEKTSSKQ